MEHNEIYTKLIICDLGSKLTFARSRSKPMKHLNGSKNEIAGVKDSIPSKITDPTKTQSPIFVKDWMPSENLDLTKEYNRQK